MVIALSICRCTAIHKICQLGLFVRGYLMKPARNRPQMRKNRYKNVLSNVITIVKLPHESRFFINFFMDVRAKGHMMLFNFFPPFRFTPAVTITHQTLATKVTKQFSVFSNFEKNVVFFPLYQTRIHVAAK